jgi:ubiquinone/menaquinone biosynthesis C-methylase UbiE
MNGYGRGGWWTACNQLWSATRVRNRVLGVRSDLNRLPFPQNLFDGCLSAHALRNMKTRERFHNISNLVNALKTGGLLLIAEFTTKAYSESQQILLDLFSMKTKLSGGEYSLPTESELISYLEAADLRIESVSELDISINEPIWSFDINARNISQDDRQRYQTLIEKGMKIGIKTSPTIIVCGRKTF